MVVTGPTPEDLWTDALILPGKPNLVASLLVELAAYLGMSVQEAEGRCRSAMTDLASAWHNTAARSAQEIDAFYQRADIYLFDLTWWHALQGGTTALVQVDALQSAQAQGAYRVLDFGSGIGSLGLLYARYGMEVTLADVNPRLQDYARYRFQERRLKARFLDLPDDRLPAATFDFISAMDVLEHVPDAGSAVCALARALVPGGTLYVNFPDSPDAAHPMHLWQDHRVVLNVLAEAQLFLEARRRCDGGSGAHRTRIFLVATTWSQPHDPFSMVAGQVSFRIVHFSGRGVAHDI